MCRAVAAVEGGKDERIHSSNRWELTQSVR